MYGKCVLFSMCSAVRVAWLAQNIRHGSRRAIASYKRAIASSGVQVPLVNNNARSCLTIFTRLCRV